MTISKEELNRRVKIENHHLLTERMDKGEIVVGVTAHFFNWEAHCVAFSAAVDKRTEVVYLKINSPVFENLMQKVRTRFGGGIVERSQFTRNYIKNKNIPRTIILAADQRPQLSEIRYWTTFLNRETAFFEGAEKLAKRFGHAVVYSETKKPKRGHYIFTYHLIAAPPYKEEDHSITEKFIQLTEKNIQEEPSLYLWSHNRWKEKKTELHLKKVAPHRKSHDQF